MTIKVMADSGGSVTYSASEIGAAWNTFAGGSDYIISDVGDEMLVVTSTSSRTVTVKTGRAVINGRVVDVTSDTSITVPASRSDLYLVLRVDLGQPVGSEGSITYCTSSQIKDQNLNTGTGGIHDLVLGQFVSTSTGISTWNDQRNITSVSGGARFRIIKDQNGNTLATPIIFEIVGVV